jgi:uncharacterized protein (DUF2147 family)
MTSFIRGAGSALALALGVALVLPLVLPLASAPAAAQAADPSGTWLTASGETRVRIAPCGANMCGTVAWVSKPGKDEKNENASLRDRNLVGIRLVTMTPAGAGKWNGSLYDYTSGKTYSGSMTYSGGNTLTMQGCVAGIFCRSSSWTKVN